MPSHIAPTTPTTFTLKLTIISRVLLSILVALYQIIFNLRPSWPTKRIFGVSFIRQLRNLTFEQKRSLDPPTGDAIKSYCIKEKLNLISSDLDCSSPSTGSTSPASASPNAAPDATLHSITTRGGNKTLILLYFHGGGYCAPINSLGHLPVVLQCAEVCEANTAAILEYSLAPEVKYPSQLIQAVAALKKLLETYRAEDVILGGDSAGGSLVLGVLAHLVRPHPMAPRIELNGSVLRGAVLASPWVKLSYEAPSYRVNAGKDYLSREAMEEFTRAWAPMHGEIWADPISVAKEFWDAVPVKAMLITAGTWEVFVDDILEFAKMVGAEKAGSGARVELAVCHEEVHDQWLFDCALGCRGEMLRSSLRWLKDRAT